MSSDANRYPNILGQTPCSHPEQRRRYLIRCRRPHDGGDLTDTDLVRLLCAREALDKEKVVHIGTTLAERRVHIVVDYDNPTHEAAQICAFAGKRFKKISIPLEMRTYLNNWVERWKSQRESGIRFPIRDMIFPKGSTDPNAPRNLILTTGSAVPPQGPLRISRVETRTQDETMQSSNA